MSDFGQRLRQMRENARRTRAAVAEQVGLDVSYLYRLETGKRNPSRDVVLVLAAALNQDREGEAQLLAAAGFAPHPLLNMVREAVRTRGRSSRRSTEAAPNAWEPARWAEALEQMGLNASSLGRVVSALAGATDRERLAASQAVSSSISGIARWLECPVRSAVIPAAGGLHRLLAPHVMQSLLIRAVREAVECGISRVAVVLAPGTQDTLLRTIQEALALAVVPAVEIGCVVQPEPEGLGDAVLRCAEEVGDGPFCVVLPDDVVKERGRGGGRRELDRMIQAYRQLPDSVLVAVKEMPRSQLTQGGVVQISAEERLPGIHSIVRAQEKPHPADSILSGDGARGVVGRYLLPGAVFPSLSAARRRGQRLELTEGLSRLIDEGCRAYAYLLESERQDLGGQIDAAGSIVEMKRGSAA